MTTPEPREDHELAAGQVQWHSSEEDGGPDVGIMIGLGDGRALWFGELLNSEGRFGFTVFSPTEKLAVASHDEYDEVRELLEQHVAPALRRPSPVAESGEYVVDPQPEIAGAPISKIVSYNQAHEDAVEMGYPSLTEALEHLSELRSPEAESTPTDATAVEAEREAIEAAIEDLIPWSPGTESRRGFPSPREIADAVLTSIRARTPKES